MVQGDWEMNKTLVILIKVTLKWRSKTPHSWLPGPFLRSPNHRPMMSARMPGPRSYRTTLISLVRKILKNNISINVDFKPQSKQLTMTFTVKGRTLTQEPWLYFQFPKDIYSFESAPLVNISFHKDLCYPEVNFLFSSTIFPANQAHELLSN